MFNPTSLDKVFVQARNLKAKVEKEMQTLGKKKENSFVKNVPKQAAMKTIAENFIRSWNQKNLKPKIRPKKKAKRLQLLNKT